MADFPGVGLTAIHGGGYRDPLLADEFGTGDEAARPEFTAPTREPMTLRRTRMPLADLAALEAHYRAHRGTTFIFTDPETGVSKTCRYESPPVPKREGRRHGVADVTVVIREVG